MAEYSLRYTSPGDPDRLNDYEFCCDGVLVGRCYFTRGADNRDVWRWTIYGISSGGRADTLEQAMQRFRETFESAGGLQNRTGH